MPYAFNEHQKMQPASLAKIMTFYLTLDALKAGKIAPATDVTISEKAWRLSMNDTVSRMFLQVGQKVGVNDLLYGLMVSSGNDAAVALAEYLGGSTDAFTQMMNDKAKEIGLKETHFDNPDGLPEPGESTTAADMVALAHSLVRHHPERALNYTSQATIRVSTRSSNPTSHAAALRQARQRDKDRPRRRGGLSPSRVGIIERHESAVGRDGRAERGAAPHRNREIN